MVIQEMTSSAFIKDIPWLSQNNNVENPSGSCNVTALAMGLRYFGVVGNGDGQLEDQLYREMLDRGLSRHELNDLAAIARLKGVKARVNKKSNWDEVKAHLAKNKPVIVAGYFTRFGHIILLRGYNDATEVFRVNDPNGEWFASGYRTDLTGENLAYSYAMMDRCCCPDGDLWALFLG